MWTEFSIIFKVMLVGENPFSNAFKTCKNFLELVLNNIFVADQNSEDFEMSTPLLENIFILAIISMPLLADF